MPPKKTIKNKDDSFKSIKIGNILENFMNIGNIITPQIVFIAVYFPNVMYPIIKNTKENKNTNKLISILKISFTMMAKPVDPPVTMSLVEKNKVNDIA